MIEKGKYPYSCRETWRKGEKEHKREADFLHFIKKYSDSQSEA